MDDRRKLSRVQVMEAALAAVLSAAVLSTFGGMTWLVVRLPNILDSIQESIVLIRANQAAFEGRFSNIESRLRDKDSRIIRLESR